MRKFKERKIKPSFVFLVDGQTESWYLQKIKRNEKNLNINIKPELPQNKKLKDQFEQIKELARDYDEVFWIVDLDTILKETNETKNAKTKPIEEFKSYIKKIKEFSNIEIIINNPCLEIWFVLHYEQTSKSYNNCSKVIKIIKKYLPDYEKTQVYFTKQNDDIYSRLKSKLKTAIKNAKQLGEFDKKNPNKSICEMYKIFEKIKVE